MLIFSFCEISKIITEKIFFPSKWRLDFNHILAFPQCLGKSLCSFIVRKGRGDHVQICNNLGVLFSDDYFFLLENCPSTALIRCLSQQWIRKPPFSSMGATILSFISAEHKKHGFQLLEEMNNKSKHSKIWITNFQTWHFNSSPVSAYKLLWIQCSLFIMETK